MFSAFTDTSGLKSTIGNTLSPNPSPTEFTTTPVTQHQLSTESLSEPYTGTNINSPEPTPENDFGCNISGSDVTDIPPAPAHEQQQIAVTSEHEWHRIITEYLRGLTRHAARKALLTREQLAEIRSILGTATYHDLPPRPHGYEFAKPSDRSWARRTFQLGTGDRVLKRDPKAGRSKGIRKDERMALRQNMVHAGISVRDELVVPREDLYHRLVLAHLACDHGGRDQTCKSMRFMGYMP